MAQYRDPAWLYLPHLEQWSDDAGTWLTITRAGSSFATAQTIATTHPTIVQPRRRLSVKIAVAFVLRRPTIDGRKYMNAPDHWGWAYTSLTLALAMRFSNVSFLTCSARSAYT
jgi:hypothetical protein